MGGRGTCFGRSIWRMAMKFRPGTSPSGRSCDWARDSPDRVVAELGTQEASHTVRYICHLLPSVEADPWFQGASGASTTAAGTESRSSTGGARRTQGKTQTASAMAVAFGILHPEATRQTVSSPFKEAGDMQLWGGICSAYYEALDKWGASYLRELGVTMKMNTAKNVVRFGEAHLAGTIKLVAMDEVREGSGVGEGP